MHSHGDRRRQIADFRDSFERIKWLYLHSKFGIKAKSHLNGFFDTDRHSVSWTKNPLGLRASWVAKCQLTSWRSVPKKPRTWVFIIHDDVIKWKHFPRNWPFVREIHRSPVNFPHKGQWRGALMFSLIYVWINDWVNNREAGDLIRQHGHYDVIVMRIPLQHPVQPT